MRYLLDTHVWLWSLVSPDRIGQQAVAVMQDAASTLCLSAASSWEIAIKYHLGKLPLPDKPESFVLPRLTRDGIESIPVQHGHAVRVAELPNHHRDPFDRLLIATAQVEDLTILTADRQISRYDVSHILA